MKEILLQQSILECLDTYYGIRTDKLTLVLGGADLDAVAYRTDFENSSYFIKVIRGPYNEAGLAVLELLRTTGIQHVIQPIRTIEDKVIQKIDNFSLIVFPFIDAKNGFDCSLSDVQWRSLGKTLRQIHGIEIPPKIQDLIRRETFSSKWRETVKYLYNRMEQGIIGDEMALKTVQFLMDQKQTILRLVDQAEKLCQEVQEFSTPLVLCHSDIHAGNVLVCENKEIYIVDWDNPILAPKERDLMFIGGGVAGVWNQLFEEELFYEGYGPTKIDSTILAYYRHERIVEDIAEYAQALILANSENPDAKALYTQFTDMFEASNVIDIAFKTAH